jgi:hypothetical protein
VTFHCCDSVRRNATAEHPTLNGLDYLEVLDRDLPDAHPFRQRTLFLHFLKPVSGLSDDNVRLTGGDRLRDVRVSWVEPGQPAPLALTPEEAALLAALPDADRVLVVRTNSSGDRSTYRLRLVRSPTDDLPPDGIDPPPTSTTWRRTTRASGACCWIGCACSCRGGATAVRPISAWCSLNCSHASATT